MAMGKKCEGECERERESEREMKARMREKMLECSRSGNIDGLYLAMEEYPELLEEFEETKFVNTPLHDAAAAGHTDFAIEILNLMPSFGKKLNPQGLSPLHLAIENRKVETALALVKIDKQLVLVKGKNGQTPLHFAVKKVYPRSSDDNHTDPLPRCDQTTLGIDDPTDPERDKLLVDLLLKCPDSIHVLNNSSQTAIHVAAEYRNFEAVHLLVNWLITRERDSVLHWKDKEGNTALHVIAARADCPQGLHLLKMMVDIVKINKRNINGETPLDVAKEEAKKVLQKAGGRTSEEIGEKPSTVDYLLAKQSKNYAEALTRAFYFLTKEMTLELRNTILVVAVLIATATYQGVLSPPGGLFSAEGNIDLQRLSDTTDHEKAPAAAGTMVMRRSDYKYFMPTNTMAFILSNAMIIFVIPGRFFLIILRASLFFMCISYLLALEFISESNQFSKNMLFAASCAIILGYLLKVAYYVVKAYYAGRSWFSRRLKVMVSNRYSGKHDMSVFKRMRKQYKLIKTD